MGYEPQEWADGPGGGTPITAARLNHIEQGVADASGDVAWDDLQGKPAVIAAGDTPAQARQAIGAGTSNLTIGTTASTAKAGNWTPTIAEVEGLQAALDGLQQEIDALKDA